MSKRPVLTGTAVMGSLAPELVKELLAVAEAVQVRAQEWLFVEGDLADRLYFVVSGRLQAVVENDDGRKVLRVLGPGAAIGELAVLTGSRRSASVQALRDSELLEIEGDRFRRLLGRVPALGLGLATALARQLQDSGGLRGVDAPPSVFAVTAQPGTDVAAFWSELPAAFEEVGSTLAVQEPWPGPESSAPADWGRRLSVLERDYDHVLLLAPAEEHASWAEFAVRQADRIVVATGVEPPRGNVPEGCDVVFLGEPGPADVAAWLAHARPRAHHVVRSESVLGEAAGRIARRLTGRSLGLVLSGGGARAFAHVGVLEVLAEEGVTVDRVGGTSMGAFIAAMTALGWSPERMREACEREIRVRAPFSDYTLPRYALIRARRAESMLRRVLGDATLEQLAIPLFTVSADLVTARLVVHRTGPLVEAVGSSMAIPGLAPPVSYEHHLLIDGGVLNNLPIDVMAADEPGAILAVDVMRRLARRDLTVEDDAPLPTILETLSRATVLGSVERAEANRRLATVVITPDVQDLSLRDFRHLDRAIDAGRRAAEAAFASGAKADLLEAVSLPAEPWPATGAVAFSP